MNSTPIASPRRLAALWLTGLLALGFYLRVHGVNDYAYSLDEMLSVSISKGHDVREVMEFSKYETHPPYAQILRHYLLEISDAPWFLRGESVLFGLLCILVYYAIGNQMGGRLAGCAAAYFVAFGYGNILQSQIVRNYSLLALLIGAAFYCYRAYLAAPRIRCLLGYALTILLAMMTHYSAFFALACMGAAGFIAVFRNRRALAGWVAANGMLTLYFAYVYATELRHNDYESMWIPPAGSDYNTLGYRLAVFVAYIPATVSYFLHASFVSEVGIASTVLFVVSMIWLHSQPLRRPFFYEALCALLLGAALVTANLYPYLFKVGGRHAMWVLPYVVLPVSLCLAHVLRRAAERLPRMKRPYAIAAMFSALAVGVAINPARSFLDDRREYQADNQQMRQIKTFLAALTPQDAIVTAGLNVMYLLPDGVNYYRTMAQAAGRPWYYTAGTGVSPVFHARQYPPFIDGREISMHEFVTRLDQAGAFRHSRTVWFFNTDIISLTHGLSQCKGLPVTLVQYPPGGLADLPDNTPIAEFIGVPYGVLAREVLPQQGLYAHCL